MVSVIDEIAAEIFGSQRAMFQYFYIIINFYCYHLFCYWLCIVATVIHFTSNEIKKQRKLLNQTYD